MLLNEKRAVKIMEENEIDVLIATLPENVYYVTGFSGWTCQLYKEWQSIPGQSNFNRQAYAILDRENMLHPFLVVPMSMGNEVAQNLEKINLKDVYTYGSFPWEYQSERKVDNPELIRYKEMIEADERNSPNSGQALIKLLMEKGVSQRIIGVDMENLSQPVYEIIFRSLPGADIRDAGEVFRFIRMVKSPEERERLRIVSQVNEKAREVFLQKLRLGITEIELFQVYKENITNQGGIYEFFNCPAGARGGGFFSPSNNKMQKGDLVWYDFGCIVDHYHSDLGNTAILGKPTKEQSLLYDGVVDAMQSILETIHPGIKPSQVASVGNEILKKHGLKPHSGGILHGVGLEIRDYPIHGPVNPKGLSDGFIKSRSTDIPLEENMVINLEISHLVFGFGGAQIEHTLIVTKSGYKLICPQPRELYTVS